MFANVAYDYKANKIHLWEYQNGQRIHIEELYTPYCYLYDERGEFKDLWGKKCKIKLFDNYFKQREFLEKMETLEGDINPEDRTLVDRYSNIKEFVAPPELDIHYIDIETTSEKGFPNTSDPQEEILLISVYSSKLKKFNVFGTYDYTSKSKAINYIWCNDETELLKKYFSWHKENYPDIISGWNVLYFDIPYILNRTKYIISETFISRYSPIGILRERKVEDKPIYDISGVSQLDYLQLYKQFSINERESYKLDYIAETELGEGKLKFDGDIRTFWKKDWKTFVEYCIKDTLLIKRLEDKLGYIKLVQTQSYMCRVPLEKYSSPIKKFDNYLMSILKDKKIVLPTTKHHKAEEIPGGYVSEPKTGYYKKVVSYDFTSLYPHIMMALNISPETFLGKVLPEDGKEFSELDMLAIKDSNNYSVSGKSTNGKKLKEFIIKNNLILSPNGSLFKSQTGFIPSIIKDMFAKRKEFKKKMQEMEKLYSETKNEEYNTKKSVYDSLQYSTKIMLNSGFGILANPHYRLFNLDGAKSITLTGQKLAKFTGNELNKYFKENFDVKKDSVLYSDTDSVYLDYSFLSSNSNFIETVDEMTKTKIEPLLEEKFNYFSKDLHNIEKNLFDLKRESIASGAIFIQKKKYALYVINEEGVTYPKPKLKVKGIEIVRSSTPSFCREKIKDIVEELFRSECSDKADLINKLRDIKKKFNLAEISEIAFPRNVNGMKTYINSKGMLEKGTPMQVRAANNYNKLLRMNNLETKYESIIDNDKIKFIYLNDNNPLKENIIAFKDVLPKEFGFEKYLDKEIQFEKSFLNPIKTITEALGWKINLNEQDMTGFF